MRTPMKLLTAPPQAKKVENFPEGLLFNYQSCINYGTPGNATKEKRTNPKSEKPVKTEKTNKKEK